MTAQSSDTFFITEPSQNLRNKSNAQNVLDKNAHITLTVIPVMTAVV